MEEKLWLLMIGHLKPLTTHDSSMSAILEGDDMKLLHQDIVNFIKEEKKGGDQRPV